jgi:TonB family protein
MIRLFVNYPRRLFMVIILLLLLPFASLAQYRPDAKTMLARADAAIFTARTVRLAALADDSSIKAPPSFFRSFQFQWEKNGRAREEFFLDLGGRNRNSLTVFDGTNRWIYWDRDNRYTKSAAKNWVDTSHELDSLSYGRDPVNIIAAVFEKDETVEFNGRSVDCYVVRAKYRGWPAGYGNEFPFARTAEFTRQVWITRDGELIVRDYWENGGNNTARRRQYTMIDTDVDLSASLFAFQPPAGSTVGTPDVVGGVMAGRPGGIPTLVAPPPPPPARSAAAAPPPQIRVRADVLREKLISEVKPVYPQLAKQSRIQGAVTMEIVIEKTGSVSNVKVISGPPLLRQAAIDAVSQWKFKPTLLNGEAVQVLSVVTLSFTLPNEKPLN